ncbi:MAG: hypothetical protein A2487_01680, partial [Candidatus Raymondbacteria bacterium RifOxyC12_full_50_8]
MRILFILTMLLIIQGLSARVLNVHTSTGSTMFDLSTVDSITIDSILYPGMVNVPAGTFQMGSTANSDEQPIHTVTISSFWMDTTEVTQADYLSVTGVNPSNFTGDSLRPVNALTWYDAVLYCNARSKRDGKDTAYFYSSITGTPFSGCTGLADLAQDTSKHSYRLPTEAEWEFSCRAGTTTSYYWGGGNADQYAWYFDNAGFTTHTVASKAKNAFGLYDMCGNVFEWCWDWKGNYGSGAETDPTGPATGTYRVLRGGGWGYRVGDISSAVR